ncbi:hypothetical protein Mgra_00002874 [Meloidogyne graminicola]|uniref:Uncharacterized protein n=1 Tax=Meloidogyne graminicola TaxID=189291 RepID=A0A8S9ZWE0_9BILA|nr:hypothetical protein Mgra_00002874 [Meloidogyne graminicola]
MYFRKGKSSNERPNNFNDGFSSDNKKHDQKRKEKYIKLREKFEKKNKGNASTSKKYKEEHSNESNHSIVSAHHFTPRRPHSTSFDLRNEEIPILGKQITLEPEFEFHNDDEQSEYFDLPNESEKPILDRYLEDALKMKFQRIP